MTGERDETAEAAVETGLSSETQVKLQALGAHEHTRALGGFVDGVMITEEMVAVGAKALQSFLFIESYYEAQMAAKIIYSKMKNLEEMTSQT